MLKKSCSLKTKEEKNGGFYLKFCLDKKRGNKNDFKNTLCQVTRDSGQSCLNWLRAQKKKKLVLGGKFRCNVHGNFLGGKNSSDYV